MSSAVYKVLYRLQLQANRCHKIAHAPEKIRQFFIDHFLRHYNRGTPAKQIVIDLDVTDDPLHGNQEGRFFHGCYDRYCYLPLYAFCDRYLAVTSHTLWS